MSDPLIYSAAITLGVFSAPHCVGMCGGLVSAIGMGLQEHDKWGRLVCMLKYNAGRLLSYAMLGLIAGLLGMTLGSLLPWMGLVLRGISGCLLMLAGLYIGGWWSGLRFVEQALSTLWLSIKPQVAAKWGGSGNGLLLMGMSWGCLPCGLVYSALSMAVTGQSAVHGALFMLCFGLGTLPVMLTVGVASASIGVWLRHKLLRAGVGAALVGYGVWTISAILS